MKKKAVPWCFTLIIFLILITCIMVAGDSLDTDKEVLLKLKSFLQEQNPVNQGRYSEWNGENSNPCQWRGISCSSSSSSNGPRVIGVNLSDSNISGKMFDSFSELTDIRQLDLSKNTIDGAIPDDLNQCRSLVYLNLSHNILEGQLNLSGLSSLEILDLSTNRLQGDIRVNFPEICRRLIVTNISSNNFTGFIDFFDECWNLQYLDLSSNNFFGNIWTGFPRLFEFSVSENSISGQIPGSIFPNNCSLQMLDLSVNNFQGEFPGEISFCKNLIVLNVYGNNFTGQIPSEIGMVSSIESLFLGDNSFSRMIPETLLNLTNLEYLDLSKSNFGGEIQEIFGRFTQLKFLVLHGNSYKGGLDSSGILRLSNLSALDLSYNNFSFPLPTEISQMKSLSILMMSHNQLTGNIPLEYGNLLQLQALDLSFNMLSGQIPQELGKLSSLLWLMLADNSLDGEIPPQIGNCSSLLWLNLANNQLSGTIPPQLAMIGRNATSTFESNRGGPLDLPRASSGECSSIKRWIPADYPPFNFMYTILTRKNCRSIWDKLLKGIGIFPMCTAGSVVKTYEISGYVQLSGNRFSGPIPADIGLMQNFSMVHLGFNGFYGELPAEIGQLQLAVLNITQNMFSGTIPAELGNVKCLQILDLSYNNFSGMFPTSFNQLSELSKFNISYNPFISGAVPTIGQFATFEKESYLGDPLLDVPDFIINRTNQLANNQGRHRKTVKLAVFLLLLGLTLAFLVFGILSLLMLLVKTPEETAGSLLWNTSFRHNLTSSSSGSSPFLSDTVKVIRLDETAFTHADILKATDNFSEERILGKGGYGTVYRGVLPDGREVAVKKLQREGIEGEREFRAEMEVLRQNGFGWPHPNLVMLYGWCLDGLEKILVYEYMGGGSLEDVITDPVRLTWRRRIDIAIDVARALVFLHHECYLAVVHRDVKASNVLLDIHGRARVTDFGLARVVNVGDSHVSTTVAGTIGYIAPEYGHTWQATTKGDVYSYGVLVMELATGRRALDGGEECLVEWARRVMGNGENGLAQATIPVELDGSGPAEGAKEMCELLQIAVRCIAETPQARPNMKEVLAMLIIITNSEVDFTVRMSISV